MAGGGSSLVLPIDHLDFYFYHYRGVLCALYVYEGSAQQTGVPAEVGGGGWHAVDCGGLGAGEWGYG